MGVGVGCVCCVCCWLVFAVVVLLLCVCGLCGGCGLVCVWRFGDQKNLEFKRARIKVAGSKLVS